MRLREFLAMDGLGLVVLVGGADLDREVRTVYTTDQLDPGRYLVGDEVVLTGLMWRTGPADSERFVTTLRERGVTALGAGDPVHGTLPPDLVQACARHGVTMFEVPLAVSFATVTDRAAQLLRTERESRLARTLGLHRRLVSGLAAGAGLTALITTLAAETGAAVRVLSCCGRLVAGDQPIPEGDVDQLTRAFLGAPTLPAVTTTRAGRTWSLFPLDAGAGPRLTRWFLACPGDERSLAEAVRESVRALATIAAIERSRLDDRNRLCGLIAGQIVRQDSGGRAAAHVATALAALGIGPDEQLVVASVEGRPGESDVARAVLEDLSGLAWDGPAVATDEPDVLALIPVRGGYARLVAALRAGLAHLAADRSTTPLVVGVSTPVAPGELRSAVAQARSARSLAAAGPAAWRVMSGEDLDSHLLLLAAVPEGVRATYARRVLGALLDPDVPHQTDLVATLEEFLACSGSWSACGARLHLHVNTVRYRIGRVEKVTGRDLSRLADRVDVLLALQVARAVRLLPDETR